MSRAAWKASRRDQIAQMVARLSEPVPSSTVAVAFGISTRHAADNLRRLSEQGRVRKIGEGPGVLWGRHASAAEKAANAPAVPRTPGVDYRYAVPADFRGPFSLAGIGRDVQTGQPWGARA